MTVAMQSWDPRGAPVRAHHEVYTELLTLKDAEILDVGGGETDMAGAIAAAHKSASVTVLAAQAADIPLSNLTYKEGTLERIPAGDDSFDIVVMNGALHRLAEDGMADALREVRRVLRPGGLAYVAEPVFGGAFNELLRLFDDTKKARQAAFEALRDVVASGAMTLVAEKFFLMPLQLADFAAFEQRYIGEHRQVPGAQKAEVRKRFERHLGPKGAVFQLPMRIDLLAKAG